MSFTFPRQTCRSGRCTQLSTQTLPQMISSSCPLTKRGVCSCPNTTNSSRRGLGNVSCGCSYLLRIACQAKGRKGHSLSFPALHFLLPVWPVCPPGHWFRFQMSSACFSGFRSRVSNRPVEISRRPTRLNANVYLSEIARGL